MLSEIIEKLGHLSAPDREMDLTIHLAIEPEGPIAGLMKYPRGHDNAAGMHWDIHRGGSVVFEKYDEAGRCFYNGGYPLPKYTASIDAALTLVPQGWEWTYDSSTFDACVTNYCGRFLIEGDVERYGSNKNPAIAICIAALRARDIAK